MNATGLPPHATQRLHLACTAELARLPEMLALADRACHEAGASEAVGYAVRLAVEEVAANVVKHGYGPARRGPIELALEWDHERIRIEIRDHAPRFDPTRLPAPDLAASWESRSPGGLGWALVHQLMDRVQHQYHPATGNHLVLTKNLAP